MRTSSRFDRSICGTILSCRSSPAPTTPPAARRSARCLHSTGDHGRWGRRPGGPMGFFSTGLPDPAAGTLLPWLLPPSWRLPTKQTLRMREPGGCRGRPRMQHTAADAVPALPSPPSGRPSEPAAEATDVGFWRHHQPTPDKQELLSFVDPPAEGDSVDDHLDLIRDPYLRRYARAADGPEVAVSHDREDAEFPTWDDVRQADEAVQLGVHALGQAVWSRLRNPARTSAAEVYEQYRRLPGAGSTDTDAGTGHADHADTGTTRMAYIPATLRHQLLKALGMVEKKNAQSMMRYFAVVADVRDGGFSLWRAEWNAAISFASRYVGASTASETEAAVRLWREMEQEAGMPGNEVTFNILFDVASKAGNFTLAEMVYQEMEKRGLRFNRYHHVSLIHFFGLKMDADGVRTAYREMVEAGEMIDVVVLNCVMAGFLRCGEEDAAQRVYRQMCESYLKRLRKGKTQTAADLDLELALAPPSNFAAEKAMTQVLMMLAKISRHNAALRAGFQQLVPTRPDLATYRILIHHYAVRMGDLTAVARFLDDMKTLRIPLHGAVFLALFKGFAQHGGRDGTGAAWSEQRLRGIWAALLKALDEEAAGLYVSTWLILWVLRAFDRCSSPESIFKAYNSLTSRWDPSDDDADYAIGVLHRLLKGTQGQRERGRDRRPSMLRQLGSRAYEM